MWPFSRTGGGEAAPPPEDRPEAFDLGGRRFVSVGQSTVEHDAWFWAQVERHGLREFVIGQHESYEDFARRMLGDVLRSGAVLDLVGGLIVPEGTDPLDWTPAMAGETAAFIAKLHRPEDKETLRTLVASLLVRFFEDGLSSSRRSLGSSSSPENGAHAPSEPDALTATAAGDSSSAPWQAPTPSTPSG